jgi:hypothetical protein
MLEETYVEEEILTNMELNEEDYYTSRSYWQTAEIAITTFNINTNNEIELTLLNNLNEPVQINYFYLTTNNFNESINSEIFSLNPGEQYILKADVHSICSTEDEIVGFDILMDYTNKITGIKRLYTNNNNQLVTICRI